jgi:hypothetical protein
MVPRWVPDFVRGARYCDMISLGSGALPIEFGSLACNEGYDATLKDRDRCCAATRVEAPLARKIDPRDFGRTIHARP